VSEILIKLSSPLRIGEEEITELKLRRPKGRDYRAIKSATPMAMCLELGAAMAEQPPSVIDLLDGDDVKKLVEAVGPFLS
jgi:hypothetical protein